MPKKTLISASVVSFHARSSGGGSRIAWLRNLSPRVFVCRLADEFEDSSLIKTVKIAYGLSRSKPVGRHCNGLDLLLTIWHSRPRTSVLPPPCPRLHRCSACFIPSLLQAFCKQHVGLVSIESVWLQPFTGIAVEVRRKGSRVEAAEIILL